MGNTENTEKKTVGLPSAAEIKSALAAQKGTDATARLLSLFDADTFVELGAYTKRSFHEVKAGAKDEEFEGVICGYGAVAGQPVFAFAQDSARMKGALDATHAKKICSLYELAIKNGAPVVGIFDCAGADIFEGVAALAGYGKIMQAVSAASGIVPQVAWISGNCIGSFAAIAAMFDMTVQEAGANLYVTSPALTGEESTPSAVTACVANSKEEAAAYVRHALSFLPQNNTEGTIVENAADDLNRILANYDPDGDVRGLLGVICDCGDFCEIGADHAPEIVTVLTKIGGVRCGILASNYAENKGRISAIGARRAARFAEFCDAFGLPLVTLVNSEGFAVCADNENAPFAADLAKLAAAYTRAENAKVTVVLNHAIGGAFTLLGSKSVGADVAYALETAEIGVMNAAAAVAFAENDKITTSTSREELEEEWRVALSSPVAAASTGEIDDIITMPELRQRICSALLLLAVKGSVQGRRHSVLPL